MKRLIDGPMFRAMLAEHGAELVLHGHNHEQQLIWLDGPQRPHPGGRRAVGLGDHQQRMTSRPPTISIAIDGGPGAWQCEMVSRGLRAGPRRHHRTDAADTEVPMSELPASAQKVQDAARALGLDDRGARDGGVDPHRRGSRRRLRRHGRADREVAGVPRQRRAASRICCWSRARTASTRRASRAHLGEKLKRPDADAVRALTGYAIGGIPPFGHDTPLATYMDRGSAAIRRDLGRGRNAEGGVRGGAGASCATPRRRRRST